jgi:hypothetical protein
VVKDIPVSRSHTFRVWFHDAETAPFLSGAMADSTHDMRMSVQFAECVSHDDLREGAFGKRK